jgi:hypothetical protein
MNSINLNQNNVYGNNNSRLLKKFPTPVKFDNNEKIAFNNAIIPHSFYNIDKSLYDNNQLTIIYNNQSTIIILDDGYYTLEDINFRIQVETLKTTNNLPYCITESGDYMYFVELVYNSTFYSVQLNVYTSVLPLRAANPKNAIFNLYCPQVIFNNKLNELLGFELNVYYPNISTNLTNYTVYSSQLNKVPNFAPLSNILITCNLIYNSLDEPNNIIYNFSTNLGTYGNNISIKPSEMIFLDIIPGIYSEIEINFLNASDFRPINIRDKNLSISFIIKKIDY